MNHSDGGGNDLDEMSDDPSSPESDNFDDSDLLNNTSQDDVTAQLAAAGKSSDVVVCIELSNFFNDNRSGGHCGGRGHCDGQEAQTPAHL